MSADEQKAKARARQAAYRARQKALHPPGPPKKRPKRSDEDRRAANAESAKRYRERAHESGRQAKSETWWQNNRDRHRENVRRWREENIDRARELGREGKKRRTATPWGAINNRLFTVLHNAVRAKSDRVGVYSAALGYHWTTLHAHLEAQFTDGMTWENWGEVWELDHIEPLSAFHYVDLLDPLFKQAWRLDNLRPLLKHLNQSKGSKREPQT